ncbi:MAG: YncE family protein [Muribaculaceae bacterium]|nr:YncE family protein [Muribaculaceae bacterium]
MKSRYFILLSTLITTLLLASCRGEEMIILSEDESIEGAKDVNANPYGFYLLNEGNMGSNKASLDFMDFTTGVYSRNIYAERNPDVVKELGDVGNDAQIHDNKLWMTINASHKVEVIDAITAKRIKEIEVPNCRYIVFDGNYAYISSYVTTIIGDINAQEGAVFKIDTNTYKIAGEVKVGRQPEEMVIKNGFLYVANSGGYNSEMYDNTVSVIRLSTFTQIEKREVAINLHRMRLDKNGKIWVLSRGNYYTMPPQLYRLETNNSGSITKVEATGLLCSNFEICDDKIYMYNAPYQGNSLSANITYSVADVHSAEIIEPNFIKDGTESLIKIPYAIKVNPTTKEVFICDAKNYVSSGSVTCYSPQGIKRWSVFTGDIPSSITFTYK